MKDPDFARNLHGVYNAKGVRVPRERNLKDAGAEAFERFGYIRVAVLCRNVKAVRQTVAPRPETFRTPCGRP